MEDEDSCRICRSGPEPGAPLYHPCKCAGSIRYCHQDCLVEWLQHSRKKYCELCNHPFIFHKKYRKDMPSDGKLPRYLYVRRFVVRSLQFFKLAARALLVGFTWLALLPYININVWRFMFWSIDVTTWMGIPGTLPPFHMLAPPANSSEPASSANASRSHLSAAHNSSTDYQPAPKSSSSFSLTRHGSALPPMSIEHVKLAIRSFIKKLAHDCFEGQILSCVIVVFFVGVFLLREWILQNTPQNFDNQPNPDAVAPPQPPAAADLPPQAPAEEAQAQLQHAFERRRDQFERLFARLPELEAQAPPEQPEDAQDPAQNHEPQLDPEQQREQARLARLRRIEQMFVDSGAQLIQHRVMVQEDDHESASSHSEDEDGAAVNGSRQITASAELEQAQEFQAIADLYSTTNLQDVLGWSENGAQLDHMETSLDDVFGALNHAPVQAGTSNSAFGAMDWEQHAEDATPEHHHEQQQNAPTFLDRTDHVASSSAAAIFETPVHPDSSEHAPAQATAAQGERQVDQTPAPDDAEHEPRELGLEEAADGQDDEDAWEDESDGDNRPLALGLDAGDEADLRAAAAAVFPPPIAHPAADDQIEVGIAAEADDPEAEIGLAEEMDGILEAIGMRGPLFGIFQNLLLMIFLCGFVMLAFVMAPYIVGRTLGSGPGLIKLLALPVKLLRYVTDPVFDFLIALGANSVWPKIAAAVRMQSSPAQVASSLASEAASASMSASGWLEKLLPSLLGQTHVNSTKVVAEQALGSQVGAKTGAVAAMLVRILPVSLTSSPQWKAVADSFDIALATGLRSTLHRIGDHISAVFVRLDAHRAGTSGTDRAFCIAFGHFYWLLVLFIHQHIWKPDLQRAIADQSSLKMFMDQHVLVIKAISFIFIELVVFPLGCGLLFDICTMPLLAEASVFLWPQKVRAAPLSFAFTRWMGGTIYMFVFAQYVSATRKVLRPGVLCWIRDPNDPNFHPIREILDKRSLTQLRKIGASAVMYAAILVASVGVNTYFLRYAMGWTGLLPFRWRPFEPLSEVPIDLLVVHFALPWATLKIDPEKISELWLKAWWADASRAMRLSSYMIGGEFKDEQRRLKMNSVAAVWKGLWQRTDVADDEDEYVEDGQLCRVPADDKAITSGPLIIPLKPDGTAPTERLAEAITKQEIEAEKHSPKPTYTNIYLPSNYRTRITAILTLLWLSHCALFILGIGVPLSLGRGITAVLKRREVHDFYSYAIGWTVLIVATKMLMGGHKMWVRREKRARMHRISPGLYIVVHMMVKVKRVFKAVVLLVGVAGLVPLTVGLVIEEYVMVPLRYKSSEMVVLHLGQIWACGVIETRLLLFTVHYLGVPETGAYARFMANVDHVMRGGLYPRPRVKNAWKRIVTPVVLVGVMLLLGPIGLANVLASRGWAHVETREQEQILLRKVFGAMQSAIVIMGVRLVVRKRMESWTDLLKDEVFLESTELKNYSEPTSTVEVDGGRGKSAETQMRDGSGSGGDAVDARGDDYAAEGTLPDVLFR